ncbi:mucin-binding protein, partial [Lactobacillus porci]|uniref:mucin-binding protein n=1 Tax=Lactobacillus porci TaxID=2012477 RepID=UPI003991D23C
SDVTDDVFTPATFDKLDNSDQSFVAHLIHQKVTVNNLPEAGKSFKDVNGTDYDYPTTTAVKIPDVFTNEATVKRTISHKFETTNLDEQVPVASDIVQSVLYQRGITYTIDLVTGDYTTNLGVWTVKENSTETGGVPDEQVPKVSAGNFTGWYRYEKDDQNIDQTSLLLDNQGQAIDQTGVLAYKKYQKAIIQIIDEDSKDTNKAIYYDDQTNAQKEQGSNVDFDVANTKLQDLLSHGYIFATDETSDGDQSGFTPATMDTKDDSNQTFTIYLKHDIAVITTQPTIGGKVTDEDGKQVNYNPKTDNLADKSFTDTTTASRTVSYVFDGDSNDKPQKADLVQTSNFERPVSYKVDLATGEILAGPTYGEWTSKDDKISAAPTDVAGWYLTSSTNAGEMTLVPGQNVEGSLRYSKIQQAV